MMAPRSKYEGSYWGQERPDPAFPDPGKLNSVFGLVADVYFASRIAQAAKLHHLDAHNFDKSEALLKAALQKTPKLLILDWDVCEAEAFKLLKELSRNADLKGVPSVGCLSNNKVSNLADEAQRAGCYRIYKKSEFIRELPDILTRYAK